MTRSLQILFALLFLLAVVSMTLLYFEAGARSKVKASDVSIENTYCFASPLKARAASDERIRVTCFLLDSQGIGVSGKTFKVLASGNILIQYQEAVSNSLGKVSADVSSNEIGEYALSFVLDGRVSKQTLTVAFY